MNEQRKTGKKASQSLFCIVIWNDGQEPKRVDFVRQLQIDSQILFSKSLGNLQMLQLNLVGVLIVDFFYPHSRHSSSDEANVTGGCVGEVNDPAMGVWASVCHFDDGAFVVSEVGYFEHGAKRQCPVCACVAVLVVDAATAGAPSVELVGVVGCKSFGLRTQRCAEEA